MVICEHTKCLCGCGRYVKPDNRYIHGHNSRATHPLKGSYGIKSPNYGKHPTEETRKKSSKAGRIRQKKLWANKDYCEMMSESHKGQHSSARTEFKKEQIPWNKGRPQTEEEKRKNSESHKGQIPWMKGKHHTEEAKKKNSESCKGRIPWNKGKIGWNKGKPSGFRSKHHSEESKIKISNSLKGYIPSDEHRKKLSERRKGIKFSEETRKKLSESHKGLMVGEKSPTWKGGISFFPYCPKFNSKLKETVRERDNHTCQLCNTPQTELERKLDVHHIHYDKDNCYPDLIALCKRCNTKSNHNREYYEKLFMNKLNERGLLFWTKNH